MATCLKCGDPIVNSTNLPEWIQAEIKYCDRCGRQCEVSREQLRVADAPKKNARGSVQISLHKAEMTIQRAPV